MSFLRLVFGALALALTATVPATAREPMVALARPDIDQSSITDFGANVHLALTLSQPVLWRLYALEDPMRLVLEFGDVDWSGAEPEAMRDSDAVTAVRAERADPGWSRLVLDLASPMIVETAGLVTTNADGSAVLKMQLAPSDTATFEEMARPPRPAGLVIPPGGRPSPGAAPLMDDATAAEEATTIVLDPGHGGIDPGARTEAATEADLMLTFARDLARQLSDRGFRVVLTRDADIFVPLETRIAIAREAKGDVFLSLHADALSEGQASGATVYTLSSEAAAVADRTMTERHERDALVSGVDLSDQDDEVAGVLMSLARTETAPRADKLADAIVEGLGEATGNLHKRPRLSGGFSVLKAPDMPSVLIELGFLSNERDRERLADADWRALAAGGIADAVQAWAVEDAAMRLRLRQ